MRDTPLSSDRFSMGVVKNLITSQSFKPMKKLIFVGLLIFSSPSYTEWTEVVQGKGGSTFHIDFDRIRKVDGYVYYWLLHDYLKPDEKIPYRFVGSSVKTYIQGDCRLFRYKALSYDLYKKPMGDGVSTTDNIPDKDWRYPIPDSVDEGTLISVCNHVAP